MDEPENEEIQYAPHMSDLAEDPNGPTQLSDKNIFDGSECMI
jgi:hypothetical protein